MSVSSLVYIRTWGGDRAKEFTFLFMEMSELKRERHFYVQLI